MKNPFLDMGKYTVVQEYNRIINRSRSNSVRSCSSAISSSSYFPKIDHRPSPPKAYRFEHEYLSRPDSY